MNKKEKNFQIQNPSIIIYYDCLNLNICVSEKKNGFDNFYYCVNFNSNIMLIKRAKVVIKGAQKCEHKSDGRVFLFFVLFLRL